MNFNAPLNSVSFGQVSIALLKEIYSKKIDINLFPIGNSADLGAQNISKDFFEWVQSSKDKALKAYSKNDPTFKLWHINSSQEGIGNKVNLFSFYELDSPTEEEVNIVKNQENVFFSSNYAVDNFRRMGCKNVHFIPLGFDETNFSSNDKQYFSDNRIVFNLCGKLEKRKNHEKIIKSWIKKFGNNAKYHLQCAVYNPFLEEKVNNGLISNFLEGKKYFNINFLGFMQKNSMYNDFLNSGNIIIGMSGGEGWGLPEFHSLALGKHGVILNAHAYKDWATKDNSVLVESSGLIDAEDGVFFTKGTPFNQGNIFDFDEEAFIDGCEKAIKRVEENRINENGLKLQKEFTYKKTLESILKFLN